MIVVDASVVVSALAVDDEIGDRMRSRLDGEYVVAPHLLDVEVLSAWRRLAARGELDHRRAALAIADLSAVPIHRVPHARLLERCWELRDNLSVYDAVYVALAEALDAALVTADGRTAQAPGVRCPVEVLS